MTEPETPTATTTPAPTATQTTTPAPMAFTPEQQAEIDRRAAAARKEGERAGRDTEKAEAARLKKEADDAAELDRRTKAGEFDSVKATLQTERDTHKGRADAAEAELKTIWDERIKAMTEGVKQIPKESRDWAYYPGDDAEPRARWAWFEKAHAAAVADNTQHANNLRQYPRPPEVNGNLTDAQRAQAERDRLKSTGKYAI